MTKYTDSTDVYEKKNTTNGETFHNRPRRGVEYKNGNPTLYWCLPDCDHYTDQPLNRKAAAYDRRATAWIDGNPDIWAEWVKRVRLYATAKRRWSIAALVEDTRRYDRVNKNGEPFKVSNDLRSVFARKLCEEVEGAENYVNLRRSVFEDAYNERHESE